MIKITDNKKEITAIWSDVFGDSEEEILFFINNLKNGKCLGYFLDDKLVSMLFLVDCSVKRHNGRYIYAACTYKEYEGRGYMSALIEYAAKYEKNFLCLIPATDSLIEFYQNRKFNKSAEISDISFNESEDIKEYLLEGYELTQEQVLIYEVK